MFCSIECREKHIGDEYIMFLVKDTHNLDDCLIVFDKKKQIILDE